MRWCLVLVLLVPAALAGNASSPEVTDPEGDVSNYNPQNASCSVSGHQVHNELEDYDSVDVLAAWFTSGLEDPDVSVSIQVAADVDDGDYIVDVTARLTPQTLHGSAATVEGETFRMRHNAGSYSGVEGGSSSVDGDIVTLTAPKQAMGLVGGEELTMQITAQRPAADLVPLVCVDGSGGRDTAGPGLAYLLERLPPVPGLSINVTALYVDGAEGEGPSFTTAGDVSVVATLNVTNTGTDADNVTFSHTAPEGATVAYNASGVDLAPGASHDIEVTMTASLGPGEHAFAFAAASTGGANATVSYTFLVPASDGQVPVEDGEVPDPQGNETTDLEDGKEAPAPAVAVAVALLAAAVRRRR